MLGKDPNIIKTGIGNLDFFIAIYWFQSYTAINYAFLQ